MASKLAIAARWLKKYFQDDPKPSGDRFKPKRGTVYGDGIHEGIAGMTIRCAADELKVVKEKIGSRWFWSLPKETVRKAASTRKAGQRLKKIVVTYIFE